VGEIRLDTASIERFRSGYRERFGAVTRDDPLYESISEGRHYAGAEHWMPLFYDKLETVFDYVPDALVSFDSTLEQVYRDRMESLRDYYQARLNGVVRGGTPYHPLEPEALYLLEGPWEASLKPHERMMLSPFLSGQDAVTLKLKPSPSFASTSAQTEGSWHESLKAALVERPHPCLLACYSFGSRERIAHMLGEHGIVSATLEQLDRTEALQSGIVYLSIVPLERGFESERLLLLSEQDLFGERIIRTQKRKRKSEAFMAEAAGFSLGEKVVHKEHGIGRFEGLITMEVNGAKHDCVKLVYAGDDKLFLPVENIDMVSRYGSEADNAELDKLGGTSWQRRKAALKNRIRMAAEELLRIAAKRATRTADPLEAPANLYEEFCARFPYAETDDQQQAIEDVLGDLASGKPMDRLICGDVGFGKTEVAMRAAFAACAANDPVQVAIVTPTTLLARQHYQNFAKRFEGLPFRVRHLSRFVSAKDAKATREELKAGTVDIVIGTHALLSKQVEFKHLGLVIIDEEQHFGVAQKERLKKLRATTHVLTLSATPIPRTLHMALSGVRELSLITTPPVDRLAVRSFVLPFDEMVIREAILREFHRGGKTFYVTPRIHYMAELRARLAELVPEVKIAASHGQMSAGELDQIMNDFYDGKYDVLLSTAIIESGLDVPSANTMIIDHAEMFGLAQLYQLRGRVGRGKIRAYAYFTLPHRKTLTPQAVKRLEVMQTLDTLGAGFTLASHDMDIRGFGNLLGEEQSGHIKEVGIELYQQMLEETIDQISRQRAQKRGEAEDPEWLDDWSPQINLGTSVLIPESYVEDLDLRLSLYRRLAKLTTQEEIDSFAAELMDRFGPLPEEIIHLLDVLRIKQMCKKAGIERVDTGPKGAVFSFRNNRFSNPEALLSHITRHPKRFKLRQDQKLVLMAEWRKPTEQFTQISDAITQIVSLAA
jgi:transcription-repair coupling factor (superfamily II helicase)